MNSGGSSNVKTKDVQPQNSTVTPYGNATPFSPSWVSFLPDEMGEDGRLPMATGLDERMIEDIRNRPEPTISSVPKETLEFKEMLAKLMAQNNQNGQQGRPLPQRQSRGDRGDRGQYGSSSRSAADRASMGPGGLW